MKQARGSVEVAGARAFMTLAFVCSREVRPSL
jgi:hypothetical protein